MDTLSAGRMQIMHGMLGAHMPFLSGPHPRSTQRSIQGLYSVHH